MAALGCMRSESHENRHLYLCFASRPGSAMLARLFYAVECVSFAIVFQELLACEHQTMT